LANKTKNIPGIILAAGEGKRIGKNKALIEIDGISFLEMITIPMRNSGCDPLIVVGGANSAKVRTLANKLDIQFALNENWPIGQFSSLKTGLSSLNEKRSRVMITLVDHPFVNQSTYLHLIEDSSVNPDHILLPIFNKRRGHPVVLPKLIIGEVLRAADNLNLREIISLHKELIREINVDDPGILRDIDVEEDILGK
jgi:CTP:molybdopterin cytidylyltransferase MocA